MKRIKLGIKTSEEVNLKYNIFRSIHQEELPDNLEVLGSLNPVIVVDESLLQKMAENILEDIVPDKTHAPRGIKTPYGLSYEPLLTSIHNFTVAIKDTDTQAIESYDIKFDNASTIESITKSVTSGANTTPAEPYLNQDFELLGRNVFINETLLRGHKIVSVGYYIKVILVSDDNEVIDNGVDYKGPVATGLSKPIILRDVDYFPVSIKTAIPIIKLSCTGSETGVVYYYRIVAEDTVGNVSDPSPLFSTLLQQPKENLAYKVERCFGYDEANASQAVWETLFQPAGHEKELVFGQPGTEMFTQKGAIVSSDVPSFNSNEVLVNTSAAPVNVTYVYTVTANGCTNPSAYSVTLTVRPIPALSSTLTPSALCSGSVFSYVPASLTSGTTFSWSRALYTVRFSGMNDFCIAESMSPIDPMY